MKPQQIIRKVRGKVDDVVIDCDTFRLEQMHEDVWWAAVYRGDKQTAFWISRKGTQVMVEVTTDEIGCIDDTDEEPRP
jgi:hypothetical protein